MKISLLKRLKNKQAIASFKQATLVKGIGMMKHLVEAIRSAKQITSGRSLVVPKLLGVVFVMILSPAVSAVGMGGINVTSALGQPLVADIDLVSISKSEKDSLVARLASPEAYKGAGLEYPSGNKFKFQIESRADGHPYLKVSSVQPVNDPFVSLLVEMTWSSGKLTHEYTFLLDPPGYVPEQPAQAVVQTVAPEVQAVVPVAPVAPADVPIESVATPPVEPTVVAPVEQAAASAVPAAPAASAVPDVLAASAVSEVPAASAVPAIPTEALVKQAEHAAPTQTASAPANSKETLEVQRGDTMYKIAAQSKPNDVSLERMLVAVYRINASQFDGRNMNRIKTGKILQMPSQQDLASVSQSDALKEIHAQAADWNSYRQKLASAAGVSNQPQSAQQVIVGKISSSVADKAPVVKESAKEVLKLSKGDAPGDQASAGGKPMSEQDKKIAAQEDAIAKDKALKEEQMRAALLEKNLKDMQRLAQLKSEAATLAQPPAAQPPAAVAPQSAVSVVAAASAVKPAAPVAKPKQVKPEPALLDQILDEPLYLAGGAGILLALGGLGFVLYKRKKKLADESDSPENFGEITGRMAAPVMPSPDTGDFTVGTSAQAMSTPESDIVDPISEADLFLNFGRDVQAEEILKEALQNTPDNHQIHLKLLGIYANRKDVNSFATIARQLQDSGDADAWQQAVSMGQKLEPGNPMYGGGGGGGFKSTEDTGSATTAFSVAPEPEKHQAASALDFDFDSAASAAHQEPTPEQDFFAGSMQPDNGGQAEHMDFDITSGQAVSPSAASGMGETMDFDVGGTSAQAAVEPTVSAPSTSTDMIFDMGNSHSFAPPPAEISKPSDDGGMAFTLDFPTDIPATKPAPVAQSAAAGLAGISLNFDDTATTVASSAGNKDEHWQEVATKLDLAKAYQEMGDNDGAREIFEEVIREGDAEQRETAQNLLGQLG